MLTAAIVPLMANIPTCMNFLRFTSDSLSITGSSFQTISSILRVLVLIKARRSGLTLEAILFVALVFVLLCGVSPFYPINLVRRWVLQGKIDFERFTMLSGNVAEKNWLGKGFPGKADGEGASFLRSAGDSNVATVRASNSHHQAKSETYTVM